MITELTHKFVDSIPDDLEDGVLYISLKFRVIIHSCCCGCKSKVVTPLSPVRWKMTFDGKTVSLNPSIGNWNFKCKSHYWINKSKIEWSNNWTDEEIREARSFARERRKRCFNGDSQLEESKSDKNSKGLLNRIRKFLKI